MDTPSVAMPSSVFAALPLRTGDDARGRGGNGARPIGAVAPADVPPPLHDAQLAAWHARLTALRGEVHALVTPVSTLERHQTPAPRAWSVDQILEHLVIANAAYLGSMTRALTMQADRASVPHGPWEPTLMGRILLHVLDPRSTRRLPSPGRSRPGPNIRPDVLKRFTAGVDDLCALMRRADGVDLRAVRFPSPLASIVRLNLGDGFAVCAVHTARHAGQIARTIDAVR